MSEKTVSGGVWTECGPKAEGLSGIATAARRFSKNNRAARLAALLLMFLVQPLITNHQALVWAQTETATLSGVIQDPKGGAVPDVEVTATRIETGTVATTKTNGAGIYFFTGLVPGHYHLTVRKPGFKEVAIKNFQLNVQDKLEQNFSLEIGSIAETVTVNASGVNINTTDAAVSTVIDRQFVANMPLNGRSFQDLLTLAPGVVLVGNAGNNGNTGPGRGGEISVNGQRSEANYFTVDGVSATVGTLPEDLGGGAGFAGATPSETALGTTQALISVDALEEFRATTSTYSAEYGRTPGGQFSFTTRSGTNDWHGSAYDYFRNDALDANNWFSNELGFPKEKERQNDFGGTLGGPIIIPGLYNGKDKTFFFFSYEGLRLWTPQGVQTNPVPDMTLRNNAPAALQPLLNTFPRPNAGEDGLNDGFGLYTTGFSFPSSIDSSSIRIDHTFSDKFKVFGRYANTPTVTSSYNVAIKANSIINNRLLTLGSTAVITSRQTNELRFNITQSDSNFSNVFTTLGGATPFNLTSLPGPNGKSFPSLGGFLFTCFCFGDFATSSFQEEVQNAQRQYNLTDTHSWVVGRHSLKFGADWRRLSTYVVLPAIAADLIFGSEASVLANSIDSASVFASPSTAVEPVYSNFSAFAQDEWKINGRLALSLGLRWDVNPPPGNLTGVSPYTVNQITKLATTQLAAGGTPLWRTDWHAFAPRLGFAYQVRQAPGRETVVRGGFGTFYDMGNARASEGFNGIGFTAFGADSAVNFPLTSAELTLPPASVAAPYNSNIYAFDPNLRLPYTFQWNLAIEQALGSNSVLTASYVGAGARRLLTQFEYSPENLGNPNFNSQVCGGCLFVTKNGATSDYDALQVQFQRRLSHGLQALASYTWSHSIDDASNNFLLSQLLRSSSDFDIRHNFQAAVTYDVPGSYSNRVVATVLEHWGLDTRISVRSALPVNIIGTRTVDPATQANLIYNPNVVSGQPAYLYGSQYPGGKILNHGAYIAAPAGVEGDAGRNSARGLGAWQSNFALRREFPIHERLRLQFRAEAFNFFNHPNFSGLNGSLGSGPCGPQMPGRELFCFGVATGTLNNGLGGLNALYQIGGPRSLQIALKLQF